ncbi:hypothetical protein V8D89_015496 [Ganoderma adspersum]
MLRSPVALLVAILAFFAGHVLAELNITIAGRNITAAAFLGSQDPVRTQAECAGNCTMAQNVVDACNGDNACLCNGTTTTPIVACEQCMFTQLIAQNRRPTDDLAGQTSSLLAYKAACTNANQTVDTLVLTLPPDWDGPFGQGLTIGTTVIAVGSAFILGLFSIGIVNSM